MKPQQGQVLLITIMLLATVLVVALGLSFKSTTETQTTKLEEEAQKAFAASEALLEATLEKGTEGTILDLGLSNEFPNFTGQTTIETTEDDQFVTPLLEKDEQYTFYLGSYNPAASAPPYITSPFFTGNLTIYFGSEGNNCSSENIALELTFVYDQTSPPASNQIKRFIADPNNLIYDPNSLDIGQTNGGTIEDTVFHCQTKQITIGRSGDDVPGEAKFLLVRVITPDSSTKIGLSGNGNNLPLQGKKITAQAKTPSGVEKKVQLFQSYPQIPAGFFITRF